ncbi:glycosyltransferase family 4 protein [uncultured Psychroserpens sp.]|uniref:glycosyltransferase family 4 protein n=1 Tax=uncultured Psychroserpens sp. TaxID=255436 RepID=UPI002602C453|nr:glycosyltransferase family 4 protein [uncultured Psychroserpens sp.]
MSRKITNKPTIGIVLISVPSYSETFFQNKIKGLSQNGFNVILFVDYLKNFETRPPCKIIRASNYDGSKLNRLLNASKAILSAIFINPIKSFKLFKLDRKDGLPFKLCLKNVIRNQPFFKAHIDWLHFGFGTLTFNRENVAEVINAKMAVSFRGFDLYLSPLKHHDCYATLFDKNIRYHVLCNEMKTTLKTYHVNEEKIRIIPPAIDVDFFNSSAVKRNESEIINFTTVSRLHWKKGLVYTLEALAILKNKGLNFKFTIIGTGEEQERLVFAAYQLGILDDVIFAGKYSKEQVKDQLEQTNVYIQYSTQEGFCNAVLEAQSMGLLCVVSNAEGLSENVLHDQTGWVVQKRNPLALADRILKVLELSEDKKSNVRDRARMRAKNEFNLSIQETSFIEFYKS